MATPVPITVGSEPAQFLLKQKPAARVWGEGPKNFCWLQTSSANSALGWPVERSLRGASPTADRHPSPGDLCHGRLGTGQGLRR